MNDKKIFIIIHATDKATCTRLFQSLSAIHVPENFSAEVQPVAMPWGGVEQI